ncbi:hypothetical protein ACHAXN_011564 [Cyclotella atomus]
MAAEASALLDALMGPNRNDPVPGASGLPDAQGNTLTHNTSRSKKRSCYDPDICPLYCAWSLSDNPTWAELVAANEGAGGIDIYDLFTNTKSDLGPNPFKVDEAARLEFASLPDHEKKRLGYEDMLCRKLFDLVRQCDRSVSRNKEKLRQEVARAMKARHEGKGRGNREDLITTVNEAQLAACAGSVAQTILMEEEMAQLLVEFEAFEEEEEVLLKTIEEEGAKKKKKKRKKETTEEEQADVDPRLLEHQKKKLEKLLTIQSLSLQLPPLRDQTDNLMRQLQYLRSDTATDKIVCEVSGNFMSSRDADERIAAHYAGKQYVGWKLVRDKLKELQKRGFGRGGGVPGPMVESGRGGFRDDRPGGYGGGGGGGGYRRDEPPRYDPGYGRDRGRGGGYHDRGYDDRRGYDRGGRRY